jgi:hypothetical protein
MIMEIPDARLRIHQASVADRDAAAREMDFGCEFRTISTALLLQFVPGRDREREEVRHLQACRHRHAGLYEK